MKGLIYGSTLEIARIRLEQLIKEYDKYWDIEPIKIINSRNEFRVIFNNGDIWQAVRYGDGARGRRCNIAMVDRKISMEMVDIIIRPCLRKPLEAISYYSIREEKLNV